MSRAASLGQQVWVEARKNNDFTAFVPALRENLDLRKRYVECFDAYDEPYDVLLDDYEPEMKTGELQTGRGRNLSSARSGGSARQTG